MRADDNLLFHLVFLHLLLQHLHLHDVDRSLVGVYMGFHLHVVPFMALQGLRVFDRPGLLIFVCDKRDLVTFCFDRTCDALKRTIVLRYDGRHFATLENSMIELESVRMKFPEDTNIIVGQTHFIKTAEDMYEAVVNTVPQAKFGLAFNEASGPCLTRAEGNDDELRNAAIANAHALGAGHVFVLILRNAYPINLLNVVQNIPEVCSIFCATANPVEAIVAKTEQGRGVIGVIDGSPPNGVEGPVEINARKEFLRKIGYKR